MSDIVPSSEPLGDAVAVPPQVNLAPPPPEAALTSAQEAAAKRLQVRTWCTFTFALCGMMMGLALWLRPDTHGVETHRQLGLPPCGWYYTTGIPCPTCGCTTAVTHFAHGNLAMSLFTQPFGFAVAAVATILLPLTVFGMVTGRWAGPSMFWLNWHWKKWVYGGILLLLAAWLYKIWLVKAGLSG